MSVFFCHVFYFLPHQCTQRFRAENLHLFPPAQQPLKNISFVAHAQRQQQAFGSMFYCNSRKRTRLLHPVRNFLIEKRGDNHITLFACCNPVWLEICWSLKPLFQNLQVVHASQPEHPQILTQVAIPHEQPVICQTRQAVGVNLSYGCFAGSRPFLV